MTPPQVPLVGPLDALIQALWGFAGCIIIGRLILANTTAVCLTDFDLFRSKLRALLIAVPLLHFEQDYR